MESSILLGAISSGGISGMILHEFSNRVEKEERQSDFMSRDQTRESKGLLIVIAIFYWINASSTSFPPFLLSAFFFLFTYSHTTYFINEKDYSYQRVGMIVARVNVLSILFAFMTSRSSMDYFFAPLATFGTLLGTTRVPLLTCGRFDSFHFHLDNVTNRVKL